MSEIKKVFHNGGGILQLTPTWVPRGHFSAFCITGCGAGEWVLPCMAVSANTAVRIEIIADRAVGASP